MKILLFNSLGRLSGDLAKALCRYKNADADCVTWDWSGKALAYMHETNVTRIWNKSDLNNFIEFAVEHYDIIHTMSLPCKQDMWDMYNYFTEKIGQRHVWTESGFAHSFIYKEEIIPKHDLIVTPGFAFKTKNFAVTNTHILTGDNYVFYTFFEKRPYLRGKKIYWYPVIKDPTVFRKFEPKIKLDDKIKLFCPTLHNRRAVYKGNNYIHEAINILLKERPNIKLLDTDNYPVLNKLCFEDDVGYNIPYWNMPIFYNLSNIVIDNVLMGGYGSISLESMMCEKPVLAYSNFPENKEAPIVNVKPNTAIIYDKLSYLLDNPTLWNLLGTAGKQYAMKYHSPQAAANTIYDVYEKAIRNSEK